MVSPIGFITFAGVHVTIRREGHSEAPLHMLMPVTVAGSQWEYTPRGARLYLSSTNV